MLTQSTLRVLQQPVPDACDCHWCDRPAVIVKQWRTACMSCPSFSYACLEHCDRLNEGYRIGRAV